MFLLFLGAKIRGFCKRSKENESQVVPTYGKLFRKVYKFFFLLKNRFPVRRYYLLIFFFSHRMEYYVSGRGTHVSGAETCVSGAET